MVKNLVHNPALNQVHLVHKTSFHHTHFQFSVVAPSNRVEFTLTWIHNTTLGTLLWEVDMWKVKFFPQFWIQSVLETVFSFHEKWSFTQIVSEGRKYSFIWLNSRFHVYFPANRGCFITKTCKWMHEEALKGLAIHLLRILSTNTYWRNILCPSNDLGYKNVLIRIHLR